MYVIIELGGASAPAWPAAYRPPLDRALYFIVQLVNRYQRYSEMGIFRILVAGCIALVAVTTFLLVITPAAPVSAYDSNTSFFDESVYNVDLDTDFTVYVNWSGCVGLWGGNFDIQYDYDVITYLSKAKGEIEGYPPDTLTVDRVGSGPGGEGKLRVAVDWDGQANEFGWGVNGSGYFCALTFHSAASDSTTNISFVGDLAMVIWQDWLEYYPEETWVDSTINVGSGEPPIPELPAIVLLGAGLVVLGLLVYIRSRRAAASS